MNSQIKIVVTLAALLLINQESASKTVEVSILRGIETYAAPPAPPNSAWYPETYEIRKGRGLAVPPSLVETLACDIATTIRLDLKVSSFDAFNVPPELIKNALGFYNTSEIGKIRGYRRWTHWNFIRNLGRAEYNALASELVAYFNEKGSKLACAD